ncbi:hypothetical protein CR152_15685 [Massilia violaceinigra]|uniref:Uncharacterized protein n=1 Tax=Massilia violaceinigra TaxID=2045208 RepID=A0A2D2DLE1_9BURK|nr:hypothetical protein [Massilia violaceinigra]ATQ75807.1 hypothetical protein CR152_15685 [Massilia violaceinigra]
MGGTDAFHRRGTATSASDSLSKQWEAHDHHKEKSMTQYATTQDILDAFANLSGKEKITIMAKAKWHLDGTSFSEPLDLVHEALFLAVEGRRNWPLKIQFSLFLSMTIKSIAYAERTKKAHSARTRASAEDHLDWGTAPAANHPSAQDEAERAQTTIRLIGALDVARAALREGDRLAALVLDAILDEEEAPAIRDRLGLSAAELDAARKRALRVARNWARL